MTNDEIARFFKTIRACFQGNSDKPSLLAQMGITMAAFGKTSVSFILCAILSGVPLMGSAQSASPKESDFRLRQFMDSRHNHNHQYPARGQFVDALPPGHRAVFFGKERYHFFNGVWYRPVGHQFLVASPPFGLIVPFLPPYHVTLWVGGKPYYYANEVYYTQSPVGYTVAELPKGEVSLTSPGSHMFIYPRQGQSEQKQAEDRHECQGWAVSQTGYDPTKPPPGMPEAQATQKQADFQRAIGACLDARGYSVK